MDIKKLELYKVTRNSIEHFDKLLASFRTTIFTFNGVLISVGTLLYMNYFENVKYKEKIDIPITKLCEMIFYTSLVIGTINLLVWIVEKHYHTYLYVSALVSKEIEKQLFPNKQRHLTYQLGKAKDWMPKFPKIISSIFSTFLTFLRGYDLLYLAPVVGSALLNFRLFKLGTLGTESVLPYFKSPWWVCPLIISVIYLIIILIIAVINKLFEKEFKL